MGIWDGIRLPFTKPKKRHGLFAIEDAAARHRWVTPLLCVAFVALLVVMGVELASVR